MDVEILLVLDYGKTGVTVEMSLAQHPHAGMDIFASNPFNREMTVGYYYGYVVYAYLRPREHMTRKYGEDLMKNSREMASKFVFQLHEKVVHRDNVETVFCIVSAPFCAMLSQ